MNDLASIFSRNWLGHVAEYNNELNVVIQNYTGNPGAQFVLANDQIVNVFERIVPRYEAQVDDRVTGVPSSFERLALLSFARSEEHTSELQSLMRISYAVFCLNKNKRSTPTLVQSS